MNDNSKVFFISTYNATFIKKDIEFLKKYYQVKVANFVGFRKKISDISSTIIKIFKGVLWTDISYIWFADFRALITVALSKLIRKKTIVIVGGYEVANVPEIQYGGLLSKKSSLQTKFILRNAHSVIAVSGSTQSEIEQNMNFRKSKLIYNGVSTKDFYPKGKKEKLIITVGIVSRSNLSRKGLEVFVKSAKYLPDVNFVLIGKQVDDSVEYLKSISTPNVKFTGFISQEELLNYLQKAKCLFKFLLMKDLEYLWQKLCYVNVYL